MTNQGAWTNQIVSQVIIVGTAGQILVYSGSVAKGNLIASLSGASGTDSVGNNYGQGFNVGVWSASTGNQLQHFGIDNNGKVYIANSTGATVDFIDSTTGAILVYNSSGQSLGNLIASLSPVAGTDGPGNSYVEGAAAYASPSGDNIAVQIGEGSFFGSPAAGLFTHDLTSPATADPFVGSLAKGDVVISTGQSTGLATAAGIQCSDSVVSGVTNGNIQLVAGTITGTINVPQTPTQTLQGSAPAAYSQSFTQGTVNRVNTLINQLAAAGITA